MLDQVTARATVPLRSVRLAVNFRQSVRHIGSLINLIGDTVRTHRNILKSPTVWTVMNLPTPLSRVLQSDWFDWRRPFKQDVVVLFGIALLAWISAPLFDLPPKVFQAAVDYGEWEVDDLLFVLFVVNIAVMFCGVRRYREARNLARHDPLTGLPNRRFFEEKLEECLGAACETQQVAVLMFDLDGFKMVNDTYGHAIGDKALSAF